MQEKCQHLNHKQSCYGENIYKKVGNEKRMALLNMVKIDGKSLKEASNMLDINYSTAKTILRVYRIENRILKKTPYHKKPKRPIFITGHVERRNQIEKTPSLVNSSSADCKENSDSVTKKDKENNTTNVLNFSGSNFFHSTNDNESTQTAEDRYKNTEDIISHFNYLATSLQSCINEVVQNEMAIKRMCLIFGNMNSNAMPASSYSSYDHVVSRPIPTYINCYPSPQAKQMSQIIKNDIAN